MSLGFSYGGYGTVSVNSSWRLQWVDTIDVIDPTWRNNPWRHFVITDALCDIMFLSEAPATGRHAAKMFRFIWDNGEALPLVKDDKKFRKWLEDNKHRAVIEDITQKINLRERVKHFSLSELDTGRCSNLFMRETRTWNVNLETLRITFEEKYVNAPTIFQPTSGTSKYLEKSKSSSTIKG